MRLSGKKKNMKNFERRVQLESPLFPQNDSRCQDSFTKISIKSIGFVLSFPSLAYIANSVLAGLCEYNNQTFSTNQSIITSKCREICQCHHINGRAITKCKPLCAIEEDPKCHPHSERLQRFQRSLNHTNCTCTKKRCVRGKNFDNISFGH